MTTVSVMTSRMSTAARVYNRSPVAALTPAQHLRERRIEALIRVAGDRVARVAGRNQIDPEPARRTMGAGSARTPIGGPPERTTA